METVKDFIDRISQIENVFIENHESIDYQHFINKYLSKMRFLLERKNKDKDEIQEIIEFLKSNLERNVKYIVQVIYTNEEMKFGDSLFEIEKNVKGATREIREEKRKNLVRELSKNNPIGKNYLVKRDTGARPGQYIQGRIVYSNRNPNEDILIDHETTHAARLVIYNENGEIVQPDFDNQIVTTNSLEYMTRYKSVKSTAGYDYGENDENGNTKKIPNEELMFQFMEICTESIAGMMNDEDSKSFENGKFAIPTERMSAINYMQKFRNLLIMAIGSDDFILDMLKENTNESYQKLNDRMKSLKDGANVFEFLSIYFSYSESENDLEKYEAYATEMFLKRMENCNSTDKQEQINYFLRILETEKIKQNILSTLRKQDIEKVNMFHDQKSEKFFEDIQAGRYTITEQQIGKKTINISTNEKDKAKNQVARDEQEKEQIDEWEK